MAEEVDGVRREALASSENGDMSGRDDVLKKSEAEDTFVKSDASNVEDDVGTEQISPREESHHSENMSEHEAERLPSVVVEHCESDSDRVQEEDSEEEGIDFETSESVLSPIDGSLGAEDNQTLTADELDDQDPADLMGGGEVEYDCNGSVSDFSLEMKHILQAELGETFAVPVHRPGKTDNVPEKYSKQQRNEMATVHQKVQDLASAVEEAVENVRRAVMTLEDCKSRYQILLEEKAAIDEEIEECKAASNVSKADYLVAARGRVQSEIDAEETAIGEATQSLRDAETSQLNAELEQGRALEELPLTALQKFQEDEAASLRAKCEQRRQRDKQLAKQRALIAMATTIKKEAATTQRQTVSVTAPGSTAADEMRRYRHLQKSKEEARLRDLEEEALHRRIQAIQELRNDVEASKKVLSARQAVRNEMKRREEVACNKLRAEIRAAGENVDAVMYRKKKEVELKARRREFEDKMERNLREISERLKTERLLARCQDTKMAKSHWHERTSGKSVSRGTDYSWTVRSSLFGDTEDEELVKLSAGKSKLSRKTATPAEKEPTLPDRDAVLDEDSGEGHPTSLTASAFAGRQTISQASDVPLSISAKTAGSGILSSRLSQGPTEIGSRRQTSIPIVPSIPASSVEPLVEDGEMDVSVVADGDFHGVWQDGAPGVCEKKIDRFEQTMKKRMEDSLNTLRENIVQPQVVAGREFKGTGFSCKPECAEFKDFDVDNTYTLRLTLTNISYGMNSCKLVTLTASLQPFVSVRFCPPGMMSAGMTCSVMVTFQPKLNKDLEGEIQFLAKTGAFSIPVRCLRKRCQVSASSCHIDFGQIIVGEKLHRNITLTNSGAVGTSVTVQPRVQLNTVQRQRKSSVDLRAQKEELKSLSQSSTAQRSIASLQQQHSDQFGSKTSLQQSGHELAKSKNEEKLHSDDDGGGGCGEPAVSSTSSKTQLAKEATDVFSSIKEEPLPPVTEMERREEDSAACDEDLDSNAVVVEGKDKTVELAPHSSITITFLFQPSLARHYQREFSVTFSNPDTNEVIVYLTGKAADVPVYVREKVIDLKTCMVNFLYQDAVEVKSSASIALGIAFEVPPEMRDHLEVLPRHGYVQAKSSFNGWIKFKPRLNLVEKESLYCNKESGELDVPVTIRVAGQTRPVVFNIHATVTVTDLVFSASSVDFGTCSVQTRTVSTVSVTNKSRLLQKYGFVALPSFVEVQPGDGFGDILPGETIDIDVIFAPSEPKLYDFEITCQTLAGRVFAVECHARAVLPPLQVSADQISTAPTVIGDSCTVHFTVSNPLISPNSAVALAGLAPPRGTRKFHVVIPENTPFTVNPAVGTLAPGKSVGVALTFSPELESSDIIAEANHQAALQKAQLLAAIPEEERSNASTQARKHRSNVSSTTSLSKKSITVAPPAAEPEPVKEGSPEYGAAKLSVLKKFQSRVYQLTVPVYVSMVVKDGQAVKQSPADTLFASISAAAIRPDVVISSNNCSNILEWKQLATGLSETRSISLENTSDHVVTLMASALSTTGPFTIVNALRPVQPGMSHTLLINFHPGKAQKFLELLDLQYDSHRLQLKLKGEGVDPTLELSSKDGEVCFEDVLVGDTVTNNLTVTNTSTVAVPFLAKLESEINGHGSSTFWSNNQLSAFSINMSDGSLKAGETKTFKIAFEPHQSSLLYSDDLVIQLEGQKSPTCIHLLGRAWPGTVAVSGGYIWPLAEHTPSIQLHDPEKGFESQHGPRVVSLSYTHGTVEPAKPQQLEFVGIRSSLSKKSGGEFSFGAVTPTWLAKAVHIDVSKGTVDGGGRKTISIRFTVPNEALLKPMVQACVPLTLKSETTQQLTVVLQSSLSHAQPSPT